METTIKDSGKKSILLVCVLIMLSICAKAQGSSNFFSGMYEDLTKGSNASFYIIGGVFGFGLVVYMISKIVNKYSKEDEKNERNHVRPISYRHHHHRVIKKSA